MPPLNLSVLIPTLNRPRHLTRCLARLRAQTPDAGAFEVIIVHDGPDPDGAHAVAAFDPRGRFDLVSLEAPRLGNAHAKNLALERARGAVTVFLNDDVLPEPGLLEAHARAHAQRGASAPALVVGHSPWLMPPGPTTFDRLLARTSMIFFYDRMLDESGAPTRPPEHDWGYRHAWTLNLSAPTDAARATAFDAALANCCYEDVEFAWRFTRAHRAPVLFRPAARADHDHPYTPGDYLRRESRLGYSALGFALANPECARELFRRDIHSPESLADAEALVRADEPRAEPWRTWFESLGTEPTHRAPLAEIYTQHLPLKRHEFRRGLLAAARGEVIPGLFPHATHVAGQGLHPSPSGV